MCICMYVCLFGYIYKQIEKGYKEQALEVCVVGVGVGVCVCVDIYVHIYVCGYI